jgi:hypothetical protein
MGLHKQEVSMRKRFLLSVVVAALSVVTMGGAALAAGGFGSPGTTKFRDLSAAGQLTDSTGSIVFISVNRGMQTFKLRGVPRPPVMVGPETVLSYFGNNPDGSFVSGCLVIPDSRFTVASNLATATLNVDPTVETPCPGFLIPAGAGGRPGISNIAPDTGAGVGGDMTITANLTWTSNGAVTSFTYNSTSRCETSVAHTVGSSTNTFASVSGTVSLLADVSSQYAAINQNDSTEVATGTFSQACTGA